MTTEQKAQAYDEALERARKIQKYSSDLAEKKRMEELFPELKESEDERIRKELIAFVKSRLAGFPDCNRFITWLEKQAEQNLANSAKTCKVEPKFNIGDEITVNGELCKVVKVM